MFNRILIFLLSASLAASAATLTGTVTNGTTGKPAARDQVILIKLAGGMEPEVTTTTDAQGRYSINFDDDSQPHLIRVIHQKALYHQPAPPGTTNVDVKVYDTAAKLEIAANVDIIRMQTDQTGLAVTELFALENKSSPPRTLFNDHTFDVYLPAGASIDSAMAAGPEGMPVRSAPAPVPGDKNHYAFIFPLRPGETKFQFSYHLPYSGSFNFAPRLSLPTENLAVMLPTTMQFAAADAGKFEQAVNEHSMTVQVAHNLASGPAPAFRVSGTGTIPENALNGDENGNNANGHTDNSAEGGAASAANRPGGGIGVPEDTPDPLHHYRYYILALIGLVLAAGLFWITSRPATASVAPAEAGHSPGAATRAMLNAAAATATRAASSAAAFAVPSPQRSGLLLEALKEELFQLETERLQNKISQEEYDKAKAALDQTLSRAIKRSVQ